MSKQHQKACDFSSLSHLFHPDDAWIAGVYSTIPAQVCQPSTKIRTSTTNSTTPSSSRVLYAISRLFFSWWEETLPVLTIDIISQSFGMTRHWDPKARGTLHILVLITNPHSDHHIDKYDNVDGDGIISQQPHVLSHLELGLSHLPPVWR